MAYKVLGQVSPTVATQTTLYTVPTGLSTVVSTVSACNIGISTTIRIAVQPAAAALANQHYIVYDALLNQYETLFLTIGLTLTATDIVTVYTGTASSIVAFNIYGSES